MATDLQTCDFVIGVDFGTSQTGIAYTHISDPDPANIEVIIDWPGANKGQLKTPTEISYQNPPRWGSDIEDGMETYGWFKLHLDLAAGEQAYNTPGLGNAIAKAGPGDKVKRSLKPGKTAVEMTTDYLKLVHAHTLKTLRAKMDSKLDSFRIKYVITTPAMWSPAAQDATREAAEKAGFGSRIEDQLEMVSEPEAAANYVLKKLEAKHRNSQLFGNLTAAAGWELGNQVMICDAGGGTVDIVVYEITEIEPYLKVAETIRPQGGLCGSAGIDCAFHEWLESRLGDQAHRLDANARSRGSQLMQAFENLKHQFGSSPNASDSRVYLIIHGLDIQEVPEHNITRHKLQITHKDMKDLFDPTIDKVIGLVKHLSARAVVAASDKPLKAIFLVGGFGDSTYLHDQLNTWAASQDPPIFVPNPNDGCAAIAKGAVVYGLQSLHLDRRRLPCHYGVYLDFPYNSSLHNYADTYICAFTQTRFANDSIEWFAKRDESIDHDKRINVPFSFITKQLGVATSLQLVTSRYNEPPSSRKDTRLTKLPPLRLDTSQVPESAYLKRQVGGFLGLFQDDVYLAGFSLEMVVESASLRFEILHNGVPISVHRFR